MDVLHGDDFRQFIQTVHILDLVHELHTIEMMEGLLVKKG